MTTTTDPDKTVNTVVLPVINLVIVSASVAGSGNQLLHDM